MSVNLCIAGFFVVHLPVDIMHRPGILTSDDSKGTSAYSHAGS